jgi:3-keto-5-aminohexanoate cleavage enzyme
VVIARGERHAVLEDTLYLRKGELSEGSDLLVERTVAMARSLDLPVADVEETAALLRLAPA